MKNNTWTWIAVIGLILFGAFLYWGGEQLFKPEKPKIKSDTVKIPFDTVAFQKKFRETLQLKPIVKYKDTGSIQWKDNLIFIPYYKATKEDTIRDYNAYHTPNFGKDTIVNDSNLFFILNHGILRNRMISYNGKYFWKHPATTINNLPISQPNNKLLIGIGITSDLINKVGVSGGIDYQNKKDALYGLKITFIPNEKPMFELHHSIKIKL